MKSNKFGMSTQYIFLAIFTLTYLFGFDSFAQKKLKFGKVSRDELEMTVYEPDTSAVAVVLYDRGEYLNNAFEFTRHRRIKVLKNAGTSYGNMTLDVPSKGSFKGYVYNLENGEVVTYKLESESIHREERFEGQGLYKLFFPNVKVGSVIDVRYSFNGVPFEWRFQDLIPTAYSEVRIEDHMKVYIGFEQKGFEPITQLGENHWMAENVPAFKEEPFLTHYTNYITKLEMRLDRNWKSMGRQLMIDERFGYIISHSGFLNAKAKELRAKELPVKQLIDSAYYYIKKIIKWNNRYGVIASQSYKISRKKYHSGSVSDMNLALVALLRKLDIQAFPVILNTRENGMTSPYSPNIWKLNYVIVLALNGSEDILMDASMENGKVGIIPDRCINGFGYAITDSENGRLIELTPKRTSTHRKFIEITLDEFGEHTAKVSQAHSNYNYLEWLESYDDFESDQAYARYLEERYSNEYGRDLEIEEYVVTKNDTINLSCAESMVVNLTDYVDDLGNEYVFNPYLLSNLERNPFQSETRDYPVDLRYLKKNSSSINIVLPDGYQVTSLPDPISLKLSDGSVSFSYSASQNNGKIQIQYRLNFIKAIFSETEYLELKEFHSIISNKLSESLQIIKGT